jgi:HAMP domain-containing protein
MHFISLRTKLLLGVAAMIIIPGFLFSLFLHPLISQKIRFEVNKRAVSFASYLAKDIADPLLKDDILDLQLHVIEAAKSEEPVEYIFVLDQDNNQRLSTEKGNILDIGVPILKNGIGSLHVGIPEEYVNERVADIINPLLWMIAGLLIAGCAVAAVFALSITRPITTLKKATDALGSGKFDGKIQIKSKDEIGLLAESFIKMVDDLKIADEEVKAHTQTQEKLIKELQEALSKIKTLEGMIPICAWCKKVRDDKGYWQQVEVYVSRHTKADFSHGMCPGCYKKSSQGLDDESEDETVKRD